MLKNLYISYSRVLLDPSNVDAIVGHKKNPPSTVFNPILLKSKLNLTFRYLLWYLQNSGRLLFLIEAADARLFSRFIFFCNLLPNCEVVLTDEFLNLKNSRMTEDVVLVTLFVNSSVLHFIQEESRRADLPIVSFSHLDSNSYGNSLSIVSSDTFDAKTVVHNLLILLLVKIL